MPENTAYDDVFAEEFTPFDGECVFPVETLPVIPLNEAMLTVTALVIFTGLLIVLR